MSEEKIKYEKPKVISFSGMENGLGAPSCMDGSGATSSCMDGSGNGPDCMSGGGGGSPG